MESKISKLTRVAVLSAAVAFAAACSTDAATAPGLGVEGPNALSDSTVGARTGPAPRHEKVKACLDSAATVASSVIEVVVDKGNDGSVDQVDRYTLNRGSCLLVWLHGGPTTDAVRIDIAAPEQSATHIDSRIANGATNTPSAVTGNRSDGNLVSGSQGATVIFGIN
jgi:hypothetical protein